MLRIWRKWLRRSSVPEHETLDLAEGFEHLARSGVGAWVLAQEKARLDFVAAHEAHRRDRGTDSLRSFQEHLVRLQSVNAIVQALINEHKLERLAADERAMDSSSVGKSR